MVITQQIKQITFQTFYCPTDIKPVFKFRMEQLNYSQSDLAEVIGLKSRASEILNRKKN